MWTGIEKNDAFRFVFRFSFFVLCCFRWSWGGFRTGRSSGRATHGTGAFYLFLRFTNENNGVYYLSGFLSPAATCGPSTGRLPEFSKEKYENSTWNKETWEIRVFLICSYFSLKILSDVFECFWLLFWSRSCLKSSGRLLGTISTKFRANPTTGVQVISSNLK